MSLPEYIRNNLDAVVEEWQTFALQFSNTTQRLGSLALKDYARAMLLAIAADVQTIQTPEQSVLKSRGHAKIISDVTETAAQAYGALRGRAGFDISELVAEYRALRASVLRSWRAERIDSPTDEMNAARFHEAIDGALGESIARYSAEVERGQHLFVGMIGHDIRTPLSAISMSSEILKRSLPDHERAQQLAARIKRSTQTIDVMIADLLKFARGGLAADLPIAPAESDMVEICTMCIDDVRAAHPEARIKFDARAAARGYWDAHRMGQVMRNLLSNAIAYGDPAEDILVWLDCDGKSASLSVRNRGATIPSEALDLIFDPLVRLPDLPFNMAAARGHLGLGLYIVKEIVQAHGGAVWAESRDGSTAFRMILPLQASTNQSRRQNASASS